MRIALLGYGKMGRAIDDLAEEYDATVSLRVRSADRPDLSPAALAAAADVAIDFSRPEAAVANIELCLTAGVPVVVGTTGWHDRLPEIGLMVRRERGAIFHATNFSVGVNVFYKVAEQLAARLAGAGYRVAIEETHHTEKLDAPSGTALTLAQKVADTVGERPPIESFREPGVKGTHVLRFAGTVDTLQLSHTAHSREGFARGALEAAGWLRGRQGVFSMEDMLAG